MKDTTTLENVIEAVYQDSQNHYDEYVPVRDMEAESLNRMWIDGKSIEVLPSAQRLLSNRLRVPFSYLSRCPDDLVAQNLNYWIEREQRNRDTFFCRFAGDQLRAVFTERYTAIDHMEILQSMLEYGFQPDQSVQYSLDQGMFVIKVPEVSNAFTVSLNDEIIPGISFVNSEVGIIAFCVEAFFYRLICSNGLIASVSAGFSRFKHISRKALDAFPQTIDQVLIDSHRRKDQLLISTKTPVANPMSTISTFNQQFGINKTEAEVVKRAWESEPGDTMFAIINAYTRSAQEPGLAAEDAYRLEKIGGRILSMVKQ